jgi:hypothetical protein
MASQTPDMQALLARLEKVENQNRRLKRAGLAALLLVGSALLVGFTVQRPSKPAAVTETIEAQRFVLKNARGETRAQLGLLGSEDPQLTLLDAKGKTRLLLNLLAGQPSLSLVDGHGGRYGQAWA